MDENELKKESNVEEESVNVMENLPKKADNIISNGGTKATVIFILITTFIGFFLYNTIVNKIIGSVKNALNKISPLPQKPIFSEASNKKNVAIQVGKNDDKIEEIKNKTLPELENKKKEIEKKLEELENKLKEEEDKKKKAPMRNKIAELRNILNQTNNIIKNKKKEEERK